MKVTAIVAHPDDEVLGIGGALAKHVIAGDDVQVVVVCTNTFRGQMVNSAVQLAASCRVLGVPSHCLIGLNDQKLDQYPFDEVIAAVSSRTGALSGVVYTHWHQDLNRDHRIVSEAVQQLTRPKTGYAIDLREFPTPSSTEYSLPVFQPNTWIDISSTLELKVQALAEYSGEIQPEWLPRNAIAVRELARTLGRQVGWGPSEVVATVRRMI